MRSNRRHVRDALLVMAAALCLGESALARESKSPAPTLSSATLSDLQAAFDEHRYGDAQRLLSQAVDAGVKDLRLALIEGDLNMAQGRPAEALAAYRRADADRTQRARALEGEGVALDERRSLSALVSALAPAPVASLPLSDDEIHDLAGLTRLGSMLSDEILETTTPNEADGPR